MLAGQELGVLALGVQGIGGDHAPGQVQWLQQRGERGDLIGLAVHLCLGGHNGAGLQLADAYGVSPSDVTMIIGRKARAVVTPARAA